MCIKYQFPVFLTVVFILGELTMEAQITTSPYSIFGLGSTDGNISGTAGSMGGAGIGLLSPQTLNFQNPAASAGMDSLLSIFETGFAGRYAIYSTPQQNQSLFDANFRYMALAFRTSRRWAVTAGIIPYSSVGYHINVMTDIEGTDEQYKKTFIGDGGVNKVFLGNSVKLTRNLSLGVNASYLFGTISHSESSTDYKYTLVDKIYISNLNFDYGLNYKITLNKWNYYLGFVYNNGKTLRTNKVTSIITASTGDSYAGSVKELRIPKSYGFGLAFQKKYFRGDIDYETSRWSGLEFTNPLLVTRNSNRYSIGLEMPSHGNRNGSARMIFYRAGAQYSESYMVIDGHAINYRSVSAGVGLPVKGYLNVVNLALEAGQNGTNRGGLFRESFLLLRVDLSFKDFWFVKTRFM
jgi:hypothetical protein